MQRFETGNELRGVSFSLWRLCRNVILRRSRRISTLQQPENARCFASLSMTPMRLTY